jgi:hypothetical protein
LSTGQLLGTPGSSRHGGILWVALESTTIAQEEKVLLLKDVEEPKKTEEELKTAKTQLETRIKGLKENLTKADADLRVGGLPDGNLRDNFMKHKNGSHRLSRGENCVRIRNVVCGRRETNGCHVIAPAAE